MRFFVRAGENARWLLVAGLVIGVALPGPGLWVRPWLPFLVFLLLLLAALRMAPRDIVGSLRDLPGTLSLVLILQLALPLALIAAGFALGVAQTSLLTALVIMATAPTISGAPNIVAMLGQDPSRPLRLLILGCALLPVTVIPVFWALPALGSTDEVLTTAMRLLVLIALATGTAALIRRIWLPVPSSRTISAIDGGSAIVLAIFVLGLMSEIGFGLRDEPSTVLWWLLATCIANFGLQIVGYVASGGAARRDRSVAIGVVTGNRNIALFLIALPVEITAPLMMFIGCYQVPMFITPIAMDWLYRRQKA